MFDPPASVALISEGKLINRVKQLPIRCVTNCVDGDLEIIHRSAAHQIAELGCVKERQSALPRFIGIVSLEICTARSKCAIGIKLDAHQPQPVFIKPRRRASAANRDYRLNPRRVRDDPHSQRASIARAAVSQPIINARPHIGNRSDAKREQMFLCFGECDIAFERKRWRHEFRDQLTRCINEDPIWFGAGLFDAATGG